MYPSLARSYKGIFPFNLGTTSFIYPDDYVPNVKMLGPYLDEIELLLFESLPNDALPSKAVIAELSHLARDYNLIYNVHLPTDVSISDPKPEKQRLAVDTILKVGDLLAPLSPTAFLLHIPYSKKSFSENSVKSWQRCVFRNLEKILAGGIPAESIAVETLDYRFDLLDGVIVDLNLSVCLDLGHLIVHGYQLKALFNKYADRTSMIHLHGVKNGHDHLALNKLTDVSMEPVLVILRQFTGSVSLEVFSFDDLKTSLEYLENHWKKSKMQ
jgi:sugar phosphate isomerase/epimerase